MPGKSLIRVSKPPQRRSRADRQWQSCFPSLMSSLLYRNEDLMAPKIKFDDLISIDDWASALRKVLDAAVDATKNGNSAERLDLQDLLMSYIKRSPAKV